MRGVGVRIGGGQYDPGKPGGRGQAPPLTSEYKAIWDANNPQGDVQLPYNPSDPLHLGILPAEQIVDSEPAEYGPGDYPEPADDPPEDFLEDTPDFLEETPEHDRLWFEQKPPKDFDFD